VEHTGHVEWVQFQRISEGVVRLRDGLVEPVNIEVTPVPPVPHPLLFSHGQRVVSRISHPGRLGEHVAHRAHLSLSGYRDLDMTTRPVWYLSRNVAPLAQEMVIDFEGAIRGHPDPKAG